MDKVIKWCKDTRTVTNWDYFSGWSLAAILALCNLLKILIF